MSWIRVAWINAVFIVILITLVELIFGGWFVYSNKSYCGYLLCSSNLEYQSKSGLKTQYTKDKFGLRNRDKAKSNIDILIVGGSTSDQRYVNNNKTWDHLLQEMFKRDGINIDIVNAGIDGQSSVGHIWNFKEWFPSIPNFNPKYVLFYIGINDIPPTVNQLSFDNVAQVNNWRYYVKTNSVLYKIYYKIKYASNKVLNNVALNANLTHDPSRFINLHYSDRFDYKKNNWEHYKEHLVENKLYTNLYSLVSLTRELGAEPVFVTQKTARWVLKDDVIFGATNNNIVENTNYYYKGSEFIMSNSDFGYAEKIVSDSIMKFCNSNKLYCINGFNKFEFNLDNTYDLLHTNEEGSKEIAKKLYAEIKKLF